MCLYPLTDFLIWRENEYLERWLPDSKIRRMDVVTERRGTATWLQLPPATPPSPAPRVFPLAKPNFSRTTFHYFNIDDDNDEHIWHLLTSNSPTMPQEVSDIKHFIEICRRKDASCSFPRRLTLHKMRMFFEGFFTDGMVW